MKLYPTRGFTLIELLIVIGIFTLLTGLISTNLLLTKYQSTNASLVTSLLTDIKLQQTKAINADTQGSGTPDRYGIYFQSDRYILFKGGSYNSSDPTNLTVTLDTGQTISSVTFPSSQLVFERRSGEMVNYSQSTNTVSIKDTNQNRTKTLTVNRLGVISAQN